MQIQAAGICPASIRTARSNAPPAAQVCGKCTSGTFPAASNGGQDKNGPFSNYTSSLLITKEALIRF